MKIDRAKADLEFMKTVCTDKQCEESLDMAIRSLKAWQNVIADIELAGGMNGHIEKGEAINIIMEHMGEVTNDGQ